MRLGSAGWFGYTSAASPCDSNKLRLVAASNAVPIAAFAWLPRGCCYDLPCARCNLGELLVRHLCLFICQLICSYLSRIISFFLTAGLRRVILVPIVQKIGLAPRRFLGGWPRLFYLASSRSRSAAFQLGDAFSWLLEVLGALLVHHLFFVSLSINSFLPLFSLFVTFFCEIAAGRLGYAA